MDNENISEVVRPAGDIEAAVKNALPMIEQIASQAKSQAQRASALAMHEYRRRLQGIMMDLQDTVRDEGSRLAEQIRQAVLLQTEETALDLVGDFIHGRQAEAQNLSQTLLTEDESEEEMLVLEEAPTPLAVMETPKPAVEEIMPVSEIELKTSKKVVTDQPALEATEEGEAEEPAPKLVPDFATFIARSKTPTKA